MEGRSLGVRPGWLTKAELAAELNCSTRTIEREGYPCRRVGKRNRYVLSEVEAAIAGVPQDGGNVVRFPVERTRRNAA